MECQREVERLLVEALSVVCASMQWDEELTSVAQRLGLQGEKRRNRYESGKNLNLINYIKCDAYDVYDLELKAHFKEISVPRIFDFEGYFNIYLEKTQETYTLLHQIANKLVANNCQFIAAKLYDRCDCLMSQIRYTKRTIKEGQMASWCSRFILLHQSTDENIHDTYEKKEKENGYEY